MRDMKRHYILVAMATAQLAVTGVLAQPADLPIPAAASDEFPAGISVSKAKSGPIYVDAKGRTLYGLDLRAIVSRTAQGPKYCSGPCLEEWEPLLAPPGSKPTIVPQQGFGGGGGGGQGQGGQGQGGQGGQAAAPGQAGQSAAQGQAQGAAQAPAQAQAQAQGGGQNRTGSTTGAQPEADWGIIEGPAGPQYVYKRWHMVFVRKGDKPGQTDKDGHDKYVWNTLKYVPPVPKLTAPTTVASAFQDGSYVLTNKQGRVLFTGNCTKDCRWVPLQAGAAGRGLGGEWTVDRSGDTPQWVYRGKPVYVSQEDDPLQAPAAGTVLRP